MPFSTTDEPLGKSQFRPVWAGKVIVIIFATTCFVVRIPETTPPLTFSYLACAASDIALLALTHGNFSVPILDFLERRFLNIRMPVAACDKCVVTTGLFILLQATGHGLDPLPGVSDLDVYNCPEDHVRLRRAVTNTQKSLGIGGSGFRRHLVSCPDSFSQRACLNRPLNEPWLGIAARPSGKNRKSAATPAEQPRASPSPAEMDGAFILGMSMGGGGGFAAGLDLQQPIIGCVTVQEVEQDAFASAYGFFPAAFVYHSGHNAEEDELFGSSGGGPHGERSDDALGLLGEDDLGMGDGSDEFLDDLLDLGAPGVVEATEAETAQAGGDEGGGGAASAQH